MKTTPTARTTQTRQVVGVCLFLVAAVLAVFGQTARFGFVNYDDQSYVYQNPVVQEGLTWHGALWALSYGRIGHWHPLTWLSHEADCQIYGLWAGGAHLTNVALHAATAVLLFLLLRAMTRALWRSAFVAAVFAAHPLRAESVAWISERKDVLSGMFFMLTLLAYARYVEQWKTEGRKQKFFYALTLLFFALGLLSKNMLVTLPFVLLLLDWWPLGRLKPKAASSKLKVEMGQERSAGLSIWGLAKEKIPLFLLSAASCVATALAPEKVAIADRMPFLERANNALVSYIIYLRQMFFPVGLAIPYPFPEGGTPLWQAGLALVLLAGVTAGVFVCRQKRPYLLAGWLWYAGMLVPAIGLVQISYYSHADRYTYLPEIGIAFAVTWAVADWSAGWKYRPAALGGAMMAVIGVLAVRGHIQTSYWRDNPSLWTRALDCTSRNYIAHYCLGVDDYDKRQMQEAIEQYRKVLVIKPDYAPAWCNLGVALFQTGDKAEATAKYRRAIELNPDYAEAWGNLGAALFDKGDKAEAIADCRKALKMEPDYAEGWGNLGVALFDKGDRAEAIADYRKALQINPRYVKADYNWGNALATDGQFEEAIAHFRKALAIQPDYAAAHYGLGAALGAMEQWDDAIAHFRAALAIKPDFQEARRSLGRALLRKGDFDAAMACFEKAGALSPDPLAKWLQTGGDLLQQGDLPDAILCFRQATDIAPRSADAHANLGLALFEKGEIKQAMDSWQRSLEIAPDQPSVQNNLAWLLATTPVASLRDGPKALALAERAKQLTGDGNAAVLHTLAAAYAETGRYSDATAAARRALDLAAAQKDGDLTAKLQREIKLYEADKPMRDVPQ